MPPRTRARSAPKGPAALTEADVALLKERLETGKRPRVTLLVDTPLGAAGTSAAVVGVGDPSDPEFISVRLRDDVVPFAPTELSMPTRGRPSGRLKAAPAAAAPAPLPLDTPADPPVRPPARLVAVPDVPAEPEVPAPNSATPNDAAPKDATPNNEPRKDAEPNRSESTASPASTKPTAAKAGRGRTGSFAVTLRFTGDAWTYEAVRAGKRSSAKPLNLAAVRAFADRLDDPALRRDLQGAIDLCRQQVQIRAQALRAELEQVEFQLAELDE